MTVTGMAMAARQPRQIEKPTFVVRAPDPVRKGRWITVGAAWEKTLRDGQVAYSVKLTALPVGGWEGTLMLLPPIVADSEAPQD
jgi:hypothetical protein